MSKYIWTNQTHFVVLHISAAIIGSKIAPTCNYVMNLAAVLVFPKKKKRYTFSFTQFQTNWPRKDIFWCFTHILGYMYVESNVCVFLLTAAMLAAILDFSKYAFNRLLAIENICVDSILVVWEEIYMVSCFCGFRVFWGVRVIFW